MAQQIDHVRVAELIESIGKDSKQLASGGVRAQVALLEKAHRLCQALETPQQAMMKLCLVGATIRPMIHIGFDLKLFGLFPEEDDKAVGSAELAQKTGADRSLLVRIINHLVAAGLVGEAGPDRFYANNMTKSFATDKIEDGFRFYAATAEPALAILPKFLADRGYREPSDELDSPMQLALQTKLHAFEYIKRDPELARLFRNTVLSPEHVGRASWEDPDFYPVKDRLVSGLKDDGVVMVDVGGGMGLDLIAFHKAHPEIEGARLILQDTEQVLGSASVPSAIEKMPHDFFREQPVKGARAYYFHRVFHDWTDDKCREMLLALKPAMVPGYSRVLIQDNVVPAQGASIIQTAADLVMMVSFSGRERFDDNFRALFSSVGMEVTGIWTRDPGQESVVEAMVPE